MARWVCAQTVGCKTRSGITVDSTKVRGIQSSGMLCSAYDVGWVEAPDEVLLELPDSFSPGDSCPAAPPLEVSTHHGQWRAARSVWVPSFMPM